MSKRVSSRAAWARSSARSRASQVGPIRRATESGDMSQPWQRRSLSSLGVLPNRSDEGTPPRFSRKAAPSPMSVPDRMVVT